MALDWPFVWRRNERCRIDQADLVPPSVRDYVPAGHLVHFIRDLVRKELDLSAIFAKYTQRSGQPPYHPALMTALLGE